MELQSITRYLTVTAVSLFVVIVLGVLIASHGMRKTTQAPRDETNSKHLASLNQ